MYVPEISDVRGTIRGRPGVEVFQAHRLRRHQDEKSEEKLHN